MKEIWKSIEGYEGLYEVSNMGRVKSLARSWRCGNRLNRIDSKLETILAVNEDKKGYRRVFLCKNSRQRTMRIATLVWDAFGDKPRNGLKLQVDHIDENKANDKIGNLQLLSNRQNVSKGNLKRNYTSKFTGVSWSKSGNKWVAYIEINGKSIYLGLFKDEYQAHLAYQAALRNLD